MKKLLLIFVIAGIISVSSCSKDACKSCTFEDMRYEICDDSIDYYENDVKIQTSSLNGKPIKEFSDHLEDVGYKCK